MKIENIGILDLIAANATALLITAKYTISPDLSWWQVFAPLLVWAGLTVLFALISAAVK